MSTSAAHSEFAVLGAGISGLAAARVLEEASQSYTVIESAPTIGGLTRTVNVDGYCFDYTGHFLHLARYETPSGVPFAGLKDDDWQRVSRRSYWLVEGSLVPAPIQYHMAKLPPLIFAACRDSYGGRPALPPDRIPTFEEFVVSGFGSELSRRYLVPQNEKTMATKLDRLSSSAIKRFFPSPNEEKVRAGFHSEAPDLPEYNSKFFYPRRGGIESLVRGLASGVHRVETGMPVVALCLRERTMTTADGRTRSWSRLLSSIPLARLLERTDLPRLHELGSSLTHASTLVYNYGIRGQIPERFRDAHWIYIPDRDIPFYRVGVYSNISSAMCSHGAYSLYVEQGIPGETLAQATPPQSALSTVTRYLAELGFLDPSRVDCIVTHAIPCSYIHHTPERDAALDEILAILLAHGITPIGRYGTWDYISMEDSIHSAIEATRGLLSCA